jgi:hypothetical protein
MEGWKHDLSQGLFRVLTGREENVRTVHMVFVFPLSIPVRPVRSNSIPATRLAFLSYMIVQSGMHAKPGLVEVFLI